LPAESFDAIQAGLSGKVAGVLGVGNALAAFQSYGSTAPALVAKQLEAWRARIG
jgi:argininosuccinate lyase